MKFIQKITHSTYMIVFTLFAINSFAFDSHKLSNEVEFHKHDQQAKQEQNSKNPVVEKIDELSKSTLLTRDVLLLAASGYLRDFVCSRISENVKVPGTRLNAQMSLGLTLDIARITAFYYSKTHGFNQESIKKSAIWLSKEYAKRGVSYGLSNVSKVVFNTLVAVPFPVEAVNCDPFNNQWGVWTARTLTQLYADSKITSLAHYLKQRL